MLAAAPVRVFPVLGSENPFLSFEPRTNVTRALLSQTIRSNSAKARSQCRVCGFFSFGSMTLKLCARATLRPPAT